MYQLLLDLEQFCAKPFNPSYHARYYQPLSTICGVKLGHRFERNKNTDMGRQFFVGGNWKMNTVKSSAISIVELLNKSDLDSNVGMWLFE